MAYRCTTFCQLINSIPTLILMTLVHMHVATYRLTYIVINTYFHLFQGIEFNSGSYICTHIA